MGSIQTIEKLKSVLIFDLDDTLFETRSIGEKHVAAILNRFRDELKTTRHAAKIDAIISDVWKFPFDDVSSKYGFENEMLEKFAQAVNDQTYQFDIDTFPDYTEILKFDTKYLVTTGFRTLQEAKIMALGIRDDFDKIIIDEIDRTNRQYKLGIFKKLVSESSNQIHFYVIGDNPNSELKAGRELGMTTIQLAKFGQPKSDEADFYILNFHELASIIE